MTDRLSADALSSLFGERLEVGLGPRSAPTTPGSGFSLPSPHIGGTEQGTLSGGVEKEFVIREMSSSAPVSSPMSKLQSKMDTSPRTRSSTSLRNAIEPVCMLVANSAFLNDSCFGTIGKVGKFCTKLRDGSGDTTCGTQAHVKKAVLQEGYLYFWDASSNVGYCTPTLDSRLKLAGAIWGMRGEELGRVQVKELMEAVMQGDAITVAENSRTLRIYLQSRKGRRT
jgi:hypothetical protein